MLEKWKSKLIILTGIIPLLVGIFMIVNVVTMKDDVRKKEPDHNVEVKKEPNYHVDLGDKRVSVGGLYNYNTDGKSSSNNGDASSNGSSKGSQVDSGSSYDENNKESNSVDHVKVSKGNDVSIVSGQTMGGKNSIKIAIPNSDYSLNSSNKPSMNEKPKKIDKVAQLPSRLNKTASKVKHIYDAYGYKVRADESETDFAAFKGGMMQQFYKNKETGKFTYIVFRGSTDAEYRMAVKAMIILGAKISENDLYNGIKKSLTSGGEEIHVGNVTIFSDGRGTEITW